MVFYESKIETNLVANLCKISAQYLQNCACYAKKRNILSVILIFLFHTRFMKFLLPLVTTIPYGLAIPLPVTDLIL